MRHRTRSLLVVLTALVPAALGGVGMQAAAEPDARPVRLGVATFNVQQELSLETKRRDMVRLTSRPGVDLVGWQEAYDLGPVFDRLSLRGWETRTFPGVAADAAVSWRRGKLEYVDSALHRMHDGAGAESARYPFPPRFVHVVQLRVVRTGQPVTLLNTHLNHRIEAWETRPGHIGRTVNARRGMLHLAALRTLYADASDPVVLGTGDYNVDVLADRRVRAAGFPAHLFSGLMTSSWSQVTVRHQPLTHPATGRRIDYVYARTGSLRSGALAFLAHRVLGGYRSDHRPVLARLALAPPPLP